MMMAGELGAACDKSFVMSNFRLQKGAVMPKAKIGMRPMAASPVTTELSH
jgi:hypothetical protein